MKHVIVVCEAGITTSLLVNKLDDLAKEGQKELNISSKNTEEGLEYVKENNMDAVLLGPQVRHKFEEYDQATDAKVLKISVSDYNNMNAFSIFEQLNEALD